MRFTAFSDTSSGGERYQWGGASFYVIAPNCMGEMTDDWSVEDADRAVETVSIIMEHAGALPQELVDAYDEVIERGDSRVNRHFYERLMTDCPDSIDYFTERITHEEPKEPEPRRKPDERIRQFRPIPID